MGGVAKEAKSLAFPATFTTKHGITCTLADKKAYDDAGYGNKSWDWHRGAYFEVGYDLP